MDFTPAIGLPVVAGGQPTLAARSLAAALLSRNHFQRRLFSWLALRPAALP